MASLGSQSGVLLLVFASALPPACGSGQDRVSYVAPRAGYRTPFAVSVELLYQSTPPRPVAALGARASPEIDRFMALYRAASNAPRRIARLDTSVN